MTYVKFLFLYTYHCGIKAAKVRGVFRIVLQFKLLHGIFLCKRNSEDLFVYSALSEVTVCLMQLSASSLD